MPPGGPSVRRAERARGRRRAVVGAFLVVTLGWPAVARAASPPTPEALAAAASALSTARAATEAAVVRWGATQADLARAQQATQALQVRIAANEQVRDELQRRLGERAAVLYKNVDSGALMRLWDAGSMVRAARTARLVDLAAAPDRKLLHDVKRIRAVLEHDRAELERAEAVQRTAADAAAADARAVAAQMDQAAAIQQLLLVAAGRPGKPVDGLLCPIAGVVSFTDDWGQPRSGDRTHKGNDLFAPRGTPNVAVADGVMTFDDDDLGGIGVWLTTKDGTRWYYTHLDHREGQPRRVKQGDVLGYTGNTGNAAADPTHTHFEMHPHGGEAVNPYTTLRKICG